MMRYGTLRGLVFATFGLSSLTSGESIAQAESGRRRPIRSPVNACLRSQSEITSHRCW